MAPDIKDLLTELKAGLKTIYGSRLKGLYLYGSYARGEQEEDSDVDILIVLDKIEHYYGEIVRTGQLSSDLSLKYSVCISSFFVTESDWKVRDTSFLSNVREDAVAA
ncbi:MAG: nucleotidyltransferase domain-containing protein [Candidatus Omnitrophica bacterium]|nr:nucleotidyltransferase domain-containing protein [Candidatus Omnitrophota bacterium]